MRLLPDEYRENRYVQGLSLLSSDNIPSEEPLKIFLNPDDINQRQLFSRLKWHESVEIVQAYVLAALKLITSKSDNPIDKSQALKSLVSFVDYGNEGLGEFSNSAYDSLGPNYSRILEDLSFYFRQGQAPIDELRQILLALAKMNYFRVKKTLMLAFVSYDYPENSKWYLDRLMLIQSALGYSDNEIARYALAFLSEGFLTLKKILDKPETPSNERTELLDILELIDVEVPKWLLSSDWRVSKSAIEYCGLRKLTDTREILEHLALSENEKIQEAAKEILASL